MIETRLTKPVAPATWITFTTEDGREWTAYRTADDQIEVADEYGNEMRAFWLPSLQRVSAALTTYGRIDGTIEEDGDEYTTLDGSVEMEMACGDTYSLAVDDFREAVSRLTTLEPTTEDAVTYAIAQGDWVPVGPSMVR